MIKKLYKRPIALLFPLFFGCRIQDAADFSDDFLRLLSRGDLLTFYREVSSQNTYLYLFTILAGAVIFVLSFLLTAFDKKASFFPFLGLSGLLLSAVYLSPLLSLWTVLPNKVLLLTQIQTILLLSYYLAMRSSGIRLLHHRSKPWLRITRIILISVTYLSVLLAWFQPALLSVSWIVPLMAVFVLSDSTVCSILSLHRKDRQDGYTGLLFSGAALGTMIWYLIDSGSNSSFFHAMDTMFYLMPSILLPVQFILSLMMIQSSGRKQRVKLAALEKLKEDQDASIKGTIRDYTDLKTEKEEKLRVPSFNLKAARSALQIEQAAPLILPDSWDGAHAISDNSSEMPVLAAWPFKYPGSNLTKTLLIAEGFQEDRYAYPLLQTLKQITQHLIRNNTSPTTLFGELNKELCSIGGTLPEKPLSGVYLHFMDDTVLCGTAGAALVWYKKPGAKLLPVSSREAPVTFQQGLGFHPQSRETGKPFRLKAEQGDTLIVTSHSLLFRELEANGETYGKNSLNRVLENHDSSDAKSILAALMKDFNDFDAETSRDRQVYAAVFRMR